MQPFGVEQRPHRQHMSIMWRCYTVSDRLMRPWRASDVVREWRVKLSYVLRLSCYCRKPLYEEKVRRCCSSLNLHGKLERAQDIFTKVCVTFQKFELSFMSWESYDASLHMLSSLRCTRGVRGGSGSVSISFCNWPIYWIRRLLIFKTHKQYHKFCTA